MRVGYVFESRFPPGTIEPISIISMCIRRWFLINHFLAIKP